ncbi:hypothetical protein ANANG_G00181300 [Anguilla anguilla]|uniref:Uncharacterized protein n=1 Tax=Anguilla anguilla TaxID=7936 RepID=A0A9D3RTS1_ANGAN|nr:hypothetical protein ANANG_G00181300 [Anguilla anguilla]
MSSNAAAAISAMITSQVYPQLYYPPPTRTVTRQRREEQESEVPGIFAKGTNQAIGCFQILLGLGILVTFLITILASELTLPLIVLSVTSSFVYITNGVVSCSRWRCRARVKRRRVVIRATVITNAVGVLVALVSIIIYCLSFRIWRLEPCDSSYFCTYDKNPTAALIILLALSVLELGFAVMTTVFGWNHLKDTEDPDLVAFSREGWRDGERGDGNRKPLKATSSSISP